MGLPQSPHNGNIPLLTPCYQWAALPVGGFPLLPQPQAPVDYHCSGGPQPSRQSFVTSGSLAHPTHKPYGSFLAHRKHKHCPHCHATTTNYGLFPKQPCLSLSSASSSHSNHRFSYSPHAPLTPRDSHPHPSMQQWKKHTAANDSSKACLSLLHSWELG